MYDVPEAQRNHDLMQDLIRVQKDIRDKEPPIAPPHIFRGSPREAQSTREKQLCIAKVEVDRIQG